MEVILEGKMKIKKCPFCGNKASLETLDLGFMAHNVRCTGCGAMMPYESSKEAAVEKWNKRYKKK